MVDHISQMINHVAYMIRYVSPIIEYTMHHRSHTAPNIMYMRYVARKGRNQYPQTNMDDWKHEMHET